MVVQLQASVADLQKVNERPVLQAEVVENSSSSTQLDQSLRSWVMTAPPQEPPSLVVDPATIARVTGAVQGVLLNAQQAAAILPGKCFDGEEVTNVTVWSPQSGEVSAGTPKEIGTSPAIGTAVEETAEAPVSPTWVPSRCTVESTRIWTHSRCALACCRGSFATYPGKDATTEPPQFKCKGQRIHELVVQTQPQSEEELIIW